MTTILLAEDHLIVRQGLRALLGMVPEFLLVGEAGDGQAALELAVRHQPDVLVTDLMLPGLNGLEVIRQARRQSPRTRIVVLSMYANAAYIAEAFQAGALGYVLKQSSAGELVCAIQEALAGRRFLGAPLSEQQVRAYEQEMQMDMRGPYATLTPREREVLQLVAEGHTSAAIAGRLNVSPRTVEMHRYHLMRKLGLHAQADLIRFAIQQGLVPIE